MLSLCPGVATSFKMRRKKPKYLTLGGRSKSTKLRRQQQKTAGIMTSSVYNETVNIRHFPTLSPFSRYLSRGRRSYTPRPIVRSFNAATTPRTTKSPFKKCISSVKRTPSAIKTPSKSPRSKRVKTSSNRCLFNDNEDCQLQQHIANNDMIFPEFTAVRLDTYNSEAQQDVANEPLNDQDFTVSAQTTVTPETDDNEDRYTVQNKKVNEEMIRLIPDVVRYLHTEGHRDTMLDFFRLVSEQQFPLDNIAFRLWLEVVKWFTVPSSTQMRYSDEAKKFWKLGYMHFGGKFLHFMSGFKHKGHVVDQKCRKGVFSGAESSINFAVPSEDVLREFAPYKYEDNNVIKDDLAVPGLFPGVIKAMAKSLRGNSCCVTFDGKKLKQGLDSSSGDIDLLGFEEGKSLKEKQQDHQDLIAPIQNVAEQYKDMELTDIEKLSDCRKLELKLKCQKAIHEISEQIMNIREMRKKKMYAKENLIEKSDCSNWKNGKYSNAIAALIGYIHDIDVYFSKAITVEKELLMIIATLEDEEVVSGDFIDLETCRRYRPIIETESTETRHIKQKSEKWFSARKSAHVTGSTFSKAIGLEKLKEQKHHYDKVICGLPEEEVSEQTKRNMQHGTQNEINATATICGKVAPVLYPRANVVEEGYVEYKLEDTSNINMVISPDGSLQQGENTIAAIEIKCPVFDVHVTFPSRYLLQCLAEIECLGVNELLFASWYKDITAIYVVKRNLSLFKKSYNIAEHLYGVESPRRPTNRVPNEIRQLQKEISEACQDKNVVEFKMVVPSMVHIPGVQVEEEADKFTTSRIALTMDDLVECYNRYYELNRHPATEAVVFLLCDLNREWKEDSVRYAPICWFPKGYSLDCSTMRKILETVLNECKCQGIHVPAVSFDGQWHNLCVRDEHDKPLTILQLQKDLWKEVEGLKKNEILNEFKDLNKEPNWQLREHDGRNCIVTVNCDRLPSFSERVLRQRKLDTLKQKTIVEENEPDTAESIMRSLEVQQNETRNEQDHLPVIDQDDTIPTHNTDAQTVDDNQARSSVPTVDTSQVTEVIKEEDAEAILKMVQLDPKSNRKSKWSNKQAADVLKHFENSDDLKKMTDAELRIVVRYLNRTRSNAKIKESASKHIKHTQICDFLNLTRNTLDDQSRNAATKSTKRPKPKNVKTLAEMAYKEVSRLKKPELNIIYAEYIWPDELKNW